MSERREFKPGDAVVTWTGNRDREPGRAMTVDRITKTQIITSNGVRWGRSTLRQIGDHGYRSPELYHADDPRLVAAAEARAAKAERQRLAEDLIVSARLWSSTPSDAAVADLRDGIAAIAPHLGFTVTADPDPIRQALGLAPDEAACGIPESGHDCARVCLLPARHVEDGRWHAGLGATWSLARSESGDT